MGRESGIEVGMSDSSDSNFGRSGRTCRGCGYDLSGLADKGACPECQTSYPPYFDEAELLSSSQICGRFIWPIPPLVAAIFFGVAFANSGADGLAVCCAMAAFLLLAAAFINGPLQLAMAGRWPSRPGVGVFRFMRHLSAGERLAVVLCIGVALAPWVALLTCLSSVYRR
jgi:hypothetical protein